MTIRDQTRDPAPPPPITDGGGLAVVDAATFTAQAERRPAVRPRKPALGRFVHTLVDPAVNNGSDVASAVITRMWGTAPNGSSTVNLRVFLDAAPGNGIEWATSRSLWEDEETARAQGDALPVGTVSAHAFWPSLV